MIAGTPGEDKESYGGKFTEEEIKELKLPCSALVRILRYAAFAIWGFGERPSNLSVQFGCYCSSWPGRQFGEHHKNCRKADTVETFRHIFD
jgi:hypothetical protein